jgi:hypothetical protein
MGLHSYKQLLYSVFKKHRIRLENILTTNADKLSINVHATIRYAHLLKWTISIMNDEPISKNEPIYLLLQQLCTVPPYKKEMSGKCLRKCPENVRVYLNVSGK